MGTPSSEAVQTDLGRRIKTIREAAGISASQLSEAIGGSRSLVWHIERGLIADPAFSTVSRIAAALGATERWLGTGDGDAPTADETRAAFDAFAPRSTGTDD